MSVKQWKTITILYRMLHAYSHKKYRIASFTTLVSRLMQCVQKDSLWNWLCVALSHWSFCSFCHGLSTFAKKKKIESLLSVKVVWALNAREMIVKNNNSTPVITNAGYCKQTDRQQYLPVKQINLPRNAHQN